MRIAQVTSRAAQYDLDLPAESVRNCPRAWLRTVAELPDGKFHWGCGQAWGTYAETVALCARLEWRGALTVEGEAGRFKDKRVWTITQAGRKALDVWWLAGQLGLKTGVASGYYGHCRSIAGRARRSLGYAHGGPPLSPSNFSVGSTRRQGSGAQAAVRALGRWSRKGVLALSEEVPMQAAKRPVVFFGWRVVAAVFVLAMFGWGLGFYGPPVYLHAVRDARGWSLALVSTAVTVHFLLGAIVIAKLPKLYKRYGVATVTKVGCIALACGIAGWALAREPWQLFVATLLSGAGWVTMGAAAVNAIISPWFVRTRPAALGSAYNGASVGGVIFSPLWVAAISLVGFPGAAIAIGFVMAATIWLLTDLYYSKTPEQMGLVADGDAPGSAAPSVTSPMARPLPGTLLWRDWKFVSLAAGMALGLFAQIGLLAHLFSLLAPELGAQLAGIAAGAATAAAIAGRTLFGWLMPVGADRRLFACASYLVQVAGSIAFLLAAGDSILPLLLGVVLFGFGIGNATSLPPVIAQVEFVKDDVTRVVPMIVAIGQGTYAFAPAIFGVIREVSPSLGPAPAEAAPYLFVFAASIQAAAIAALLLGRRVQRPSNMPT